MSVAVMRLESTPPLPPYGRSYAIPADARCEAARPSRQRVRSMPEVGIQKVRAALTRGGSYNGARPGRSAVPYPWPWQVALVAPPQFRACSRKVRKTVADRIEVPRRCREHAKGPGQVRLAAGRSDRQDLRPAARRDLGLPRPRRRHHPGGRAAAPGGVARPGLVRPHHRVSWPC